jgi:oxygen-independent coproporphyrinogen-3 oxidase
VAKCPYCDFNSHVRERVDSQQWQRALAQDLKRLYSLTPDHTLVSVFFGGGTPSLMPPSLVEALLTQIAGLWDSILPIEITLEANPQSSEVEKFRDYKAAGVNRVSIGIQSLREASLKFLGRAHSLDEAKKALKAAAQSFDRYSFDLIYALPGQTLSAWKDEIEEGLAYAGEHLSLYQLTIEPGTAFYHAYQRGDFKIPDEEEAANLYELTQSIMEGAGLPAYEISNHARIGAECRHNLVYWRYGDYGGVGPGAHGRLTLEGQKHALKGYRAPETWLKAVQEQGHGIEERIAVTLAERVAEALMMGLRLVEGLDIKRFERETGVRWSEAPLDRARLNFLMEQRLLVREGDTLRATLRGRLCLNTVVKELLVA